MTLEVKRKMVHICSALFALAIGRLSPNLIVLCCCGALAFNVLLLPRLSRRGLERAADLRRGFPIGIWIYPAILLVLSLVFYERQILLALAWGAMAFGDGFAGLVGSRWRGTKLPWRPDKSWAGLIAFWLLGGLFTFLLLVALPESSRLGLSVFTWAGITAFSILFAGWVETLDGLVDDNLAVPVAAASAAALLLAIEGRPLLPSDWMLGLILVTLLTLGSIFSRKIDLSGGITGFAIAASLFLGTGYSGIVWLFAFFALGSLATRFGFKRKAALGLAQSEGGTRSMRHALANGGVPGLAGLCAWLMPEQAPLFTAMAAAALASSLADTLSSEMGNLLGKRYVSILHFRPALRGEDGSISFEGTLSGVLGALLMGLLAIPALGLATAGLIALAGFFGAIFDSYLGATLQRMRYMSNDTVNFANTLAAALLAAWLLA